MKNNLEEQLNTLIEKHIPVAFLNCDYSQHIKQMLTQRKHVGRMEILLIAYLIGATAEEGNNLLIAVGHQPLYVKRREDAIWRFALNHRLDSKWIFKEIFPQNEDAI